MAAMNADESDDDIRNWNWDKFDKAINTIKKHNYNNILAETDDPNAPYLVPRWTRPNWPDDGIEFPADEVEPQEGAAAVIKGDLTSRLRPALLPEDTALNPTRYAKRYGVFPDDDFRGTRHGRSRMSPVTEAFEHEYQNLDQIQDPYSLANIAQDIADFKKRFLEEVYEEDEEYQRALFCGFSTKERIEFKAEPLHPDFEPQESNLSGDIDPLLARDERWLSMDEGGRPRYNICGKIGEYSVDDEQLWRALQPALQLVTRVLQMEHPFWRACLDHLCAIEVPEHRKSLKHKDKRLVYIDPNEPKDWFLKQGANKRANLAFQFLQERINFCIKSSHQFKIVYAKGEVPDNRTGETSSSRRHDPDNFNLRVAIAAELMWPLLVDEYTIVEKQNCSLVIATTILHELAHAAHMAMYAEDSDTNNPEVHSRAWEDPFWANEGKAEIGCAFENQLWGGTLKPPYRTDIARFWPYRIWNLDICLWQWPDPPESKNYADSANYLCGAVLPTSKIGTLIQLDNIARLFQQGFWDTNVQIYGHRAIRFPTAGRPSFAVPIDVEERKQDWYETFGLSKGKWLNRAVRAFRAAGYGMVQEYLSYLVDEELMGLRVKTRWDEEQKRWSGRDADVKEKMEKIGVNALSNMPGESANSVTQMNARSVTQELLSALQDFRDLVLAELQYSQRMAVEYLQLSDIDKSLFIIQLWKLQQRIDKYGRKVHRIMSLNLPAKITRWTQIVMLDQHLMSSILEVNTSITLLFNSLRQVKDLTGKSSISQRELDELAKTMPSIVDSVFRNRSQRLTKIAQREVFNMPLMFRQLWDQFHEIFGRMWTKLRQDQLRAKPYVRPSKRPKKKKAAVRSPGTDYGSDIDMDRLNLRSPEPRSPTAPPRNGFPDAPGPTPAPKPTTKVSPATEAILSGRAIARLRIRPRSGEAQLPPGFAYSGHNFGNLEIRSRPLPPPGPPPPPAAGAKRGRGDDDGGKQPELPATKRQLRPNQVLPPQRFVRPPGATANAGSSSSPAAAKDSRSAASALWTDSESGDSLYSPGDKKSGGEGNNAPEEDSDDELLPEPPIYDPEDDMDVDPSYPFEINTDSDNGRRRRRARRHYHNHGDTRDPAAYSSSKCSTCDSSSSESGSGLVFNNPAQIDDPFTEAPGTPSRSQSNPNAMATTTPQQSYPRRGHAPGSRTTPTMRLPSISPYKTPPPAYTKTPPIHTSTPRHPLEGPRPLRPRSPGDSPLGANRDHPLPPHRRHVQPTETAPPPSFLETVGGMLGLTSPSRLNSRPSGGGNTGAGAEDRETERGEGRPATPTNNRARTPSPSVPRGVPREGNPDSPTTIRTPPSGMRGLLAPLGRLNPFIARSNSSPTRATGTAAGAENAPRAPRGRRGPMIYDHLGRIAPYADMGQQAVLRGWRARASGSDERRSPRAAPAPVGSMSPTGVRRARRDRSSPIRSGAAPAPRLGLRDSMWAPRDDTPPSRGDRGAASDAGAGAVSDAASGADATASGLSPTGDPMILSSDNPSDAPRSGRRGGPRGAPRGGSRGNARGGSRGGPRGGSRGNPRGGLRGDSRGGPRGASRGRGIRGASTSGGAGTSRGSGTPSRGARTQGTGANAGRPSAGWGGLGGVSGGGGGGSQQTAGQSQTTGQTDYTSRFGEFDDMDEGIE